MKRKLSITIISALLIVVVVWWSIIHPSSITKKEIKALRDSSHVQQVIWTAPDTNDIPLTAEGNLIRYGKDLIIHTAVYFGPKGKVSLMANGMNCQNCHIAGGTRLFGNNFSLVASTYPKFRSRSGRYVSIADRINGCMERSMNGKVIDSTSREMKAFIAYLKWIGKDVPKKKVEVYGAGMEKLPFLNRAADTARGKIVFMAKCQSCHGRNGTGKLNSDSAEYLYPPLWGPHSYNIGAGLYRVSIFAAYVKNNMPFGTTYRNPQLSNEEAWDVAAFVNSQPRPTKNLTNDWPEISAKPFDYPFGPYADTFLEKQHKYGPYSKIQKINTVKF